MCAKITYGSWKKRSTLSSVYSLSCGKKVKETGTLIARLKREKPKTVRKQESIAVVAESVCEAPSTSIQRRSSTIEHFGDIIETNFA